MSTPTSSKPRGRPRTLDRERVLAAAMLNYWQDEPGAVGVNEMCRRLGVSKPGLYREFGGEDGLMVAVLDHYWETVIQPSFQPLTTERPFAEVLRGVLLWLTEERGMPAGCLFAKMRTASAQLGPATSARVVVLRRDMRGAYQAWFERGLARSEVNAAIAPERAGYLLDTQLRTVQMLVSEGEPPGAVRAQAELALACLLPS